MYDLILRQAKPWVENGQQEKILDIAVSKGRIEKMAGQILVQGRKEIRVEGKVVLPGLNNCHLHLDKCFIGEHAVKDYDMIEATKKGREIKRRYTQEDIECRASKALDLAILSGTSNIRACIDVDLTVGLAAVKAMLSLKEKYRGKIGLQLVAFPQEELLDAPGTEALMRETMRMGVDVVGGRPHSDRDPHAHIDLIFKIAKEFDRDIDMSVDAVYPTEAFDPSTLSLKYYVEKTKQEDYETRVTAHHVLALSSVDPGPAAELISRVKDVDMNITTLPTSNLYTEGRRDAKKPRRGLTRVKDFMNAGVNVAIGTDNIDDVFMPHISADMLREAFVASCAAHLGTESELRFLLDSITYGGAKTLGIIDEYGMAEGKIADFVVLDTDKPLEAITAQPIKRYVIKEGEILVIYCPSLEFFSGSSGTAMVTCKSHS
jgi:cytosine deaminase